MINYFAYGSNMLAARLRARCASARVLGATRIEGFDIAFDKRSADGSGKATLTVTAGATVHGVLFAMDEGDLATLDRLEGAGFGYDVVNLPLQWNGKMVSARSYIANAHSREAGLKPYGWYRGLCLAGALEHDLPADWIRRLQDVPAQRDPDPRRASAAEARALLAQIPPECRDG